MPIIKCPNCRRRYDPGADEMLDDLPGDMGLAVVCPACGQWVSLPDVEPRDPPNAPKHVLREMRKQSRLVDEDDDRPSRRGRRRDEEGDEDDRPARNRRRRGEDEEEDDRPVRNRPKKRSGGTATLLIVGGVVAAVLLLGCCGLGVGYWYFTPASVEITSATRQTDPFGNTTVRVAYRVTSAAPAGQSYVLVASAGGQTIASPVIVSPQVGTGSAGWSTPAFRNAGTIDVWVEQRAPGSPTGKRVSNRVAAR